MGRQPTIFSWRTLPLQLGSRIERTFSRELDRLWARRERFWIAGMNLAGGSQRPAADTRNISVGVREPQSPRAGAEREELSHQLLEVPPGPRERGLGGARVTLYVWA